MKKRRQPASREGRSPSAGLRYAGMGMELGAAIVGLTLAGYWVDHKFGTGPTGLTIGAILGIVGGLYNFIRQALQMLKQDEAARKDEKGPEN